MPPLALLTVFLFPVFWCGILLLLSYLGGWQTLSLNYAAPGPPHGRKFLWQSGKVGKVSYRGAINATVAPEGLFLSPLFLFRVGHNPLLIPWSAIHNQQERTSLWHESVRFEVGPSQIQLELPAQVLAARYIKT